MRYRINQWGVATESTRELYWNFQCWLVCPPEHMGEKAIPTLLLTLSGIPEVSSDNISDEIF